MDEPAESLPPSPSKLSKTPSWVTLGFLLGALFVWFLPHAPQAPLVVAIEKPPAPSGPPAPPRLMAIEAVFAEWGNNAVWENGVTEVALWSPETRKHTDYFEVMRSGDTAYFRSISRLTRPLLTHGVVANAPLQFTETEARRQEWLREVAKESWRALTGGRLESLRPSPNENPPGRPVPSLTVAVPIPANPLPGSPAPRTGTGDGQP
ncbi:MAG: hypothetical protein EXS39_01865 [Opitutaceae bacterium]|nr:hypothetical protein [Opitutaceae bacterium]